MAAAQMLEESLNGKFHISVRLCSSGTMMRDWQTISRMPAVTDATPDIPFSFQRKRLVVNIVPASTGPQD
ncbi:hypothetical protein JOQ06_025653 [Pogonophryne albipinna]|uniref:Uncharacterized protein n=1 Tax=Pogonophryne albipinna TaxID=1090488 RepID=A0AAD6FEY4_9TELE|nr:hypothetical protein JOQ06_025653 [Pogonophryne albipinna]